MAIDIRFSPERAWTFRATVRLLTDPELNRQLRANGRAWEESHYAWQTVYRQVDEVYERLLGATGDQG